MKKPRLFLHVESSEFAAGLLQLPSLKHFMLVRSHDDQSWAEQVLAQPFDAAIIATDSLAEQDSHQLCQSNVFSETDFIFLSQTIDPALDRIMRRGAGILIRDPEHIDIVSDTLNDIAEQLSVCQNHTSAPLTTRLDQFGQLAGSSRAMQKLYRTIRKVAVTEANVLVIGESGTGKELVANTLHLASYRVNQPFVAINCGSLSPELADSELFGHQKGAFTGAHKTHAGVFEQAEGGTLFLDEITEMPLEHQVKLLRVLENHEYRPVGSSQACKANVRIVAATNRDPLQAVSQGLLREDLYFRLAHFPVRVPPLRDRAEDITGLAQHFLAYRNIQEQQRKTLSDCVLSMLKQHRWPGNVRELKHTIERAFILADSTILPEHLIIEAEFQESGGLSAIPAGMPLDEIEKAAILNTLQQNEGNKTDTAQQLGISVKTLYNKLEKYQQDGD